MSEMLVMNRTMKVVTVMTLVSVLVLVLLSTACSAGSESFGGGSTTAPVEGVGIGGIAPDFQLPNLDGQAVSLGNLRGEPVLINFWATWCPPCRSEMPYIQEIYEEWADKGLVILAVNIGESSSTVEDFMQSQNLSFTVLLDTKSDVAQKYNITGIPTTFFMDKDGIIQDRLVGAFQSKAQIEGRLSKIMP